MGHSGVTEHNINYPMHIDINITLSINYPMHKDINITITMHSSTTMGNVPDLRSLAEESI